MAHVLSPWSGEGAIPARSYTCGGCSTDVSSEKGWSGKSGQFIYICPKCCWPTIFDPDHQHPLPRLGAKLQKLPRNVDNLWNQIRDALAADAPALAVMGCRTMLIHVAEYASEQDVASGEVEGEPQTFGRFTAAEKYLEDHHWLPKGAVKLGEKIRKKGDEQAHKLADLPEATEAIETVEFTGLVLRYVYEVPSQVNDTGEGDE